MNEHDQVPVSREEVESLLRDFESQYRASSQVFLRSVSPADELSVSEDDEAEWRYLLDVLSDFEQLEKDLRGRYLDTIDDSESPGDYSRHSHDLAA